MKVSKIDINLIGKAIRTKKLSYKGHEEEQNIFRVPIDMLYYNDENGRIATYMSQYNMDNPENDIKELSLEQYNDIIAEFIRQSNGLDTFKKTLRDIESKGQLEPGVILDDGRVIDGNRRFTCLRDLYRDTKLDKFKYFECIVLETPKTENDRKELRTLEIMLQFGVEQRVKYEPIDRLVSIYNDLIGPKKIYDPDDYEKKFGIKKSELNYLISKTNLMIDYLEFIGKPLMFHIARDYKIDGPLHELVSLRKQISDEEWDRIKIIFYKTLSQKVDKTREVRATIKSYKLNKMDFDSKLEKLIDLETEIKLNEVKNKDNTQIAFSSVTYDNLIIENRKEYQFNEDSVNNKILGEMISEMNYSTRIQESRKKPLSTVQQAYKKLFSVDFDIIYYLNEEEKMEINKELENIIDFIRIIRGKL